MKRNDSIGLPGVGIAGMLVLAALIASAPPAEGSSKALSQSYSYTVGDDIAERVGGLFRVVAGLEASTLVFYDRKAQNVVSYVVGTAEDIEGAKRELGAFVVAIKEYLVPYAKSQHGIDLTDKDVTLVYFNDGGEGSPIELVRRENGEFKVATPSGDEKE